MLFLFFFFKQKTAYEMRISDWIQTCALPICGGQDFDHPPRDPYRRFVGIVARAPRQRFGVDDQDRVDIRRIVELEAAELAERDHREAAWLLIGPEFGARGARRRVARRTGKARKRRAKERRVGNGGGGRGRSR